MTPIIPADGPLHLPAALAAHPEQGLVIYNRCSSWGAQQAGTDLARLIERSRAVMNKVREAAPGKLKHVPFCGVEKGKLSTKRPMLILAARHAKDHNRILVAPYLSRFIRSEAYDHIENKEAFPTDEEFALLREMTFGVVLATLLKPTASERDCLSDATKLTGRQGRPGTLDMLKKRKVLALLGPNMSCEGEPAQWANGTTESVAGKLLVSKQAVNRFLSSIVPGRNGVRWRDLQNPQLVFEQKYRDVLARTVRVVGA